MTRKIIFRILDAVATPRGEKIAYAVLTIIAAALGATGLAVGDTALTATGLALMIGYLVGYTVGYTRGTVGR